jgi:RNA polymerase sigma-70 factor (ECF subfamily)
MSEQHLSQIITQWTMLFEAHKGPEDAAVKARRELMLRYCGAVYRYLARVVRDPHLAEELTQEFAVRFLEGRFGNADPAQGKFRNYVKTALFRLVHDHHRARAGRLRQVALEDEGQVAAPEVAEEEEAFRESWRQELLARAWSSLERAQAETGQPFHDVLRLRVDQPELGSAEIAARLEAKLGKAYSQAAIRQLLHRARERFSEALLDDVRRSLEGASLERVQEELAELRLLKYCQGAIDRRHG